MYVTLLLMLVAVSTAATADEPTAVKVALPEPDFPRAATLPEPEEGEFEALWSVLTTANEAEKAEVDLLEDDFRQRGRNIEPLTTVASAAHRRNTRNAVRDPNRRWPNATVPYLFTSKLDSPDNQFTIAQRDVIESAMRHIEQRTCVRFRPRTTADADGDCLRIRRDPRRPRDCSSANVGFHFGRNRIMLGDNCMYIDKVVHELMHALGFYHEHSRNDRDEWVKIVWDNINETMKYNFVKENLTEITHLDTPYDYHSVMHYLGYFFTLNGSDTMVPRKPMNGSFSNTIGLSPNDALKINRLYKCGDTAVATTTATTTATETTTTSDTTTGTNTTTPQEKGSSSKIRPDPVLGVLDVA